MFARHLVRSSRLAVARPSVRLASHIPPRQPFAKITPSSLTSLLELVGSPSQIQSTIAADGLLPVEQEELDAYNEDWMGKYKGQSGVVVKPKTAQEVADIVRPAALPSPRPIGLARQAHGAARAVGLGTPRALGWRRACLPGPCLEPAI